ncbi:hypothetical protein N7530_008282 [Penicillium desertorum]|uniref:Uncharacterized protein n=1 Tax=Penicillium desertorum TaxID=1303715 RepID=A0A9W9WNT6_9EURO|nr:hypothetical protein N7530_008282 [Penicillium desertorum]
MSDEQVEEESKAWLLFISEKGIPAQAAGVDGDPSYIVQQRRELVVKWTEADQSFRHDDPYPIEALVDPNYTPAFTIVVLPPVDPSHSISHVNWIKLLLLFNLFDLARENRLIGDDHGLVLVGESASPPVDMQDVLRWLCLESASFTLISMRPPVLKMLETAKEELFMAFNSPRLAKDVEFYAPGYLAMEVEGRAAEYDPARLPEGFESLLFQSLRVYDF